MQRPPAAQTISREICIPFGQPCANHWSHFILCSQKSPALLPIRLFSASRFLLAAERLHASWGPQVPGLPRQRHRQPGHQELPGHDGQDQEHRPQPPAALLHHGMKRTCLHCKQRKRDPGSRADTAWDMYYFCVEFILALNGHLYLAISGVGRAQICPSSNSLQYHSSICVLKEGHTLCAPVSCVCTSDPCIAHAM